MVRVPKDYKPDFEQLGLESVRRELLARRWDPDKLAAARLWVERQDTRQWLSGREDAPPQERPKRFRRWLLFIAIAFGAAFALVRVLRSIAW